MKAHIKLGRIFGVAVGLHYSWIIIALLVTLSLRSQFTIDHPNWAASTTWAMAQTVSTRIRKERWPALSVTRFCYLI